MEWFGPRWDSKICDEQEAVDTPLGEMCFKCNLPIEDGDQGIIEIDPQSTLDVPYHLACYREMLTDDNPE